MKKSRRKYLILIIVLIVGLVISGCGSADNAAPPTKIIEPDEEGSSENSAPAPAEPPTLTPEPEIVHLMVPGNPIYLSSQFIRDCNTGRWIVADTKIDRSYGCDQWSQNLVERPYDEDYNVFYPEFDILTMQMGQDDLWYYAEFQIFENGSSDRVNGYIGLELDQNLDRRGDMLILVKDPENEDWTTDRVQIWKDSNSDVGGFTPMVADYSPTNNNPGDGFDQLFFDQGRGDNPDDAWVRYSSSDPTIIEFAFKRSLTQNEHPFEWWGWASKDPLMPESFDLNDHFAELEIFGIDNSCGWLYGSAPDTTIPNLCYVEPTITPTLAPEQNSCGGPPPNGCGNQINQYWDAGACSCAVCGPNQYYSEALGRCAILN